MSIYDSQLRLFAIHTVQSSCNVNFIASSSSVIAFVFLFLSCQGLEGSTN
jgi:hypothetical protein